jgi:cyanophycinase-like exopeptidase
MTSVHQSLLERLGPPPVPAVLLDTPFGFQENADDIAARAMHYFRHNVGYPIEVASFRNRDTVTPLEEETMLARIAAARYVFSGPGSPTYALRQWRGSGVPALLASKVRDGGCVTFASAAAVSLGVVSVPVYEIYKVGEAPRWEDGLDLMSAIGLRVAVIPHYDNAEGGTHDTRYCYLGERRLRMLEAQLPDGVDVLGVDEHTACVFDVDAGTMTVLGRGGVTWRRTGDSRRIESGNAVPIASAADVGTSATGAAPLRTEFSAGHDHEPRATPFFDEVRTQSDAAVHALACRDPDAVVAALLEIDTQLHEWAADTTDSDERDRARELLRRHLVGLGGLARGGAADPRDRIAPVVDRVIALRRELRGDGHYDVADRLRDALVDAGVEIRDTPGGTEWTLATG